MHDRSTVYTRERDWSGGDHIALQAEERKVLALFALSVALILSALWGAHRLERSMEGQLEPINAGEISWAPGSAGGSHDITGEGGGDDGAQWWGS